jgi:hypothetical protein
LLPDKSEKPIAFISKSLTKTKQNYSQIVKEALAIVWALKKFFIYLFRTHFTLITDSKPLTQIFHPHKILPMLSTS